MLGGHKSYLTLWWDKGNGFVTFKDASVDAPMQAKIDEVNKDARSVYASAQLPRLPAECESRSRPVEIVKDQYSVGELHETAGRLGQIPGDACNGCADAGNGEGRGRYAGARQGQVDRCACGQFLGNRLRRSLLRHRGRGDVHGRSWRSTRQSKSC
jgi:hypothetical protein